MVRSYDEGYKRGRAACVYWSDDRIKTQISAALQMTVPAPDEDYHRGILDALADTLWLTQVPPNTCDEEGRRKPDQPVLPRVPRVTPLPGFPNLLAS